MGWEPCRNDARSMQPWRVSASRAAGKHDGIARGKSRRLVSAVLARCVRKYSSRTPGECSRRSAIPPLRRRCPVGRRRDGMGCGASTAQVPPRQLVLLGGGECGKTTIFKQIQLLHGSGFSDEVRNDWISAVCSSPLRSMRAILTKADELGLEVDSVSAHCCHRRARTRRPERAIYPWWSRGRGVGGVGPRKGSAGHHG